MKNNKRQKTNLQSMKENPNKGYRKKKTFEKKNDHDRFDELHDHLKYDAIYTIVCWLKFFIEILGFQF